MKECRAIGARNANLPLSRAIEDDGRLAGGVVLID